MTDDTMDLTALVLLLVAAVVVASWAWRGLQERRRELRKYRDRV